MSVSTPRRVSLWLPPIIYMAVIFHLSSESDPLPILTENIWDKILHTVEYAGLAVLIFRGFDGEGLRASIAAVVTVLIVSGYGASDEWHQMAVPLRSPDVQDWMVDTLAAALGAAACLVFVAGRRRRLAAREFIRGWRG